MVKIGVIGAGYWGPNVVRNFNQIADCEVAQLADLKVGRLEYIQQQFPDIGLTLNYKEIIQNPKIDAVYIATPVSTHFELALEALQANKHVLVEKPMCYSHAQAERLVDQATANDRVLSVGHIFQYNAAVRKLKEILDSKQIGDFLYFDSARINMGPPATEVDVLWDLAPHDLSILFYLYPQNPVSVRANAQSYTWPNKNIHDMGFLEVRFEAGQLAHIHVSWLSANKTRHTKIFATQGSLTYDEMMPEKVKVFGPGVDNRANQKDIQNQKLQYGVGDVYTPELEKFEPLRKECEEFLDAIKSNIHTVSDGQIGQKVVQVLEAGSNSIKHNGKEVIL